MANQEHLIVNISANTRGLNAGLNKAQSKLASFGGKLKAVGSQLQTRLALPLIAGGGAAIKMAADFDKSMTKIKTLVGVAGAEVDAMASSVTKFANQAGVSSGEAADALFFITSAGLRGADAMAVLEASTKAAAIGLGETKTIADLATSAMNAYGIDTLGATDATDVLTAAVREGKLEANELAGAMGRTLPVASNMGIQFHEVGAAFAAMSRTGTNAAEASTQLNSIMMGIMKPTSDAEKAMRELGLSSQGLRQQIKDEGLLSVLETLRQASERNSGAFERVFGNVRALRGILDLTGKGAAVTAEIFQRMANTSGVTAAAFDELQKSSEFKLRQGLIELKNSFTDLGAVLMESLLPLFQNILKYVTGLFRGFGQLDPTIQQLVIGFAALATILPTVLTVLGSLSTVIAAINAPIVLVAAAIAGLIYYFDDIVNASILFKNAIKMNVQNILIRANEYFQKYLILPIKTAANLFREFEKEGLAGDFSGIIDNYFSESEEVSKDAAKKIAENFADTWEKNTAEKFSGMSQLFNKVKNQFTELFGGVGIVTPTVKAGAVAEKSPDLMSIFWGAKMPTDPIKNLATSTSWSKLNSNIETSSEKIKELEENRLKKLKETADAVSGAVSNAFGNMSNQLIASLGLADSGFEGFVKGLISTITQLIAMMLSAAISQSIAGATASGTATGPAAVFTTPAFIATAVGGVLSAFAAIPKFANGGIVSGPTLGLMGEYAGARNNPEVIAPLDKLQGMIGQTGQNVNVGGEFRIQGQDLVVALQRAERNRKRIL